MRSDDFEFQTCRRSQGHVCKGTMEVKGSLFISSHGGGGPSCLVSSNMGASCGENPHLLRVHVFRRDGLSISDLLLDVFFHLRFHFLFDLLFVVILHLFVASLADGRRCCVDAGLVA